MAKTITDELKAHLAQDCTTLCTCWQISLTNGTNIYLTDLDQDLNIGGTVYSRTPGFSKTAMTTKPDMSVDNMEISGILDSELITVEDMRAGLYDFAAIHIFVVNYMDLTQGMLALRKGTLGEVTCLPSGVFMTELRGMVQRLQQTIGQVYAVDCRAILGDKRCKIPLKPSVVARSTAYLDAADASVTGAYPSNVSAILDPSGVGTQQYGNVQFVCTVSGTTSPDPVAYPNEIGDTVVDGTATFECITAWTRSGVVQSIVDQADFVPAFDVPDTRAVDQWFTYGVLTWETGQNSGSSIEIKGWSAGTGVLQTFLPMWNPITVGDRFRLSVGCDNHMPTCNGKFANLNNFRAEPLVPGQDALTYYPNAH